MSSENFPKVLEESLDYVLVKPIDFEEKMILCNHLIKSDGIQIFQTSTER